MAKSDADERSETFRLTRKRVNESEKSIFPFLPLAFLVDVKMSVVQLHWVTFQQVNLWCTEKIG